MKISTKAISVLTLAVLILWSRGSAAADYETPAPRSAQEVLTAEMISGPYYRVRETVRFDGYMHHFTVDSDFGVFEVTGDAALRKLLREIHAIAALKHIQTTEAYKKSLKEAAKKPFGFASDLVHDPSATITGLGKGVASIFENAYTVLTTKKQAQEDSRAEALLTLSAYKREYAYQLGVDVYSSNPVLQKELNRVGWAGAFGSLSFSAAMMPLGAVGKAVSLPRLGKQINEYLRERPPAKIRGDAREKLAGMGVPDDLIDLFLENTSFTPRHTAVIAANLSEMKGVRNRDVYIRYALHAKDEPSADFMMHMAELLRGYHEKVSPVQTIVLSSGLILAQAANGSALIPFPLDYGIWTRRPEVIVDHLVATYKAPGFSGNFEIWVTGRLSAMACRELEKRGIHVEERVEQHLDFMDDSPDR